MNTFNPAAFTLPKVTSIVLCNSEHPANEILASMTAKVVPNTNGTLFFVKTKSNNMVFTYRELDHSVACLLCTFEEFKAAAIAGTIHKLPGSTEVMDVPANQKHIANTMMRLL